MNFFFDKKATIYTIAMSESNWEQIKSETILYTNIECDFYSFSSPSKQYRNSDVAEQDNIDRLTVVLKWNRSWVIKWCKIILTDASLWWYWTYVVDSVQAYRKVNWQVDNYELNVSRKNV
jgi:hypothetical protein